LPRARCWSIDATQPKRVTKAAACLAAAAALLVGSGLLLRSWPAWSPADGARGGAQAVLPCRHRDLGRVPQGGVVRAVFPVTNAGHRRLILTRRTPGCCGGPARSQQVFVPPGGSAELRVEIDTAQWFGQVDYALRYTTNDPALPQFALRVTAVVEAPRPPTPHAAG